MHPDPSGLGNNVSIRIMPLAHVEDPRLCGPTFSCILLMKAASTSDTGLRSELVPTTLLSVPRPLTAGIAGTRSEILQLNGCNRGLQEGYYQGELSDGPDCQFPFPFAVNEASAANAPDSSDLHIDAIQEEQATPWGNSKPIERANSALSSAGSLDDDMEWAVDLGWITSEAGTPSQFLESSVTTVVDDLEKSTTYKAASQIVSPANTQQPTDIVLANDTKSESSAGATGPLSLSSPGRPRISASSQSFYGLRDAVCRLLGNSQQDIARALSVSEDKTPNASRTANPVPAGESDSYDGSWWMLESDTALQAYIAAFSDYFYSFIPKANIEARLKEARLPDASHLVRGFASAVIALGAYYHRQHGFTVVANCNTQKQQQKKRVITHGQFTLLGPCLLKFLAHCYPPMLTVPRNLQASIASECDIPSLVTENVAIAVMHVRELDLAYIDADDEESVLSSAYSRSTAIG
uniref:Uncharacterized protein n=1 Tax=Colletotrichum fructicola (strain Nara gc5) TaxID=1213859 RepID=L2FJJ0_COLFN